MFVLVNKKLLLNEIIRSTSLDEVVQTLLHNVLSDLNVLAAHSEIIENKSKLSNVDFSHYKIVRLSSFGYAVEIFDFNLKEMSICSNEYSLKLCTRKNTSYLIKTINETSNNKNSSTNAQTTKSPNRIILSAMKNGNTRSSKTKIHGDDKENLIDEHNEKAEDVVGDYVSDDGDEESDKDSEIEDDLVDIKRKKNNVRFDLDGKKSKLDKNKDKIQKNKEFANEIEKNNTKPDIASMKKLRKEIKKNNEKEALKNKDEELKRIFASDVKVFLAFNEDIKDGKKTIDQLPDFFINKYDILKFMDNQCLLKEENYLKYAQMCAEMNKRNPISFFNNNKKNKAQFINYHGSSTNFLPENPIEQQKTDTEDDLMCKMVATPLGSHDSLFSPNHSTGDDKSLLSVLNM